MNLVHERVAGPQGALSLTSYPGGPGEPVLLIHSDAGASEQWEAVAERLRPHRPVAAVDLRGHGDSETPADGDLSLDGRADDVAAVLAHLGWDTYWLLTHSGGGAVALAHAGTRPPGLRGLVLADPATDAGALPQEMRDEFVAGLEAPDSLAYLQGYHRSIAGDDPDVVARVAADSARTDAVTRAGLGHALVTWDPAAALDACDVPLYVVGADTTVDQANLYTIRPDLPHEVVHGTGHWVTMERPDAVVDAFERFVAR